MTMTREEREFAEVVGRLDFGRDRTLAHIGTIISVDGLTCTVKFQETLTPVSGIRWFAGAYTPIEEDLVWILDLGPGARIIWGSLSGVGIGTPGGSGGAGQTQVATLDMFHTPWDYSGFNTIVQSNIMLHGGARQANLQNEWANWKVLLQPGTWQVEAICRVAPDCGIFEVQQLTSLGVYETLATLDTYAPAMAENSYLISDPFDLSSGGLARTIRITNSNKNGASSDYNVYLNSIQFQLVS